MVPWRYHALGANRLVQGTSELVPARKTAALLVYLSLEGATTRSRLAGMLWPDSDEATARNNLTQTTRRLRKAVSFDLITNGNVLELTSNVEVDVAALRASALSGKAAQVASFTGQLLPHFDYDDASDFAEWLWATREELHALRRDALDSLVTNLEAQGDYREALVYAERLIDLDPTSELAYRHAMRLHYISGDRTAALRLFERCRTVLRNELGVEPLADTAEFADRIKRGTLRTPSVFPAEPLPLATLRPPTLAGREREWQQMEEAWQKGQLIIISGVPGVGKTRLVKDFASSKGSVYTMEARPGDSVVPYATMIRNTRKILRKNPGLVLEPWVKRALSPVMPELVTDEILSTLPHQGGNSVSEALMQVMLHFSPGIDTFIHDDLQYSDDASNREGFYFFSNAFPMDTRQGIPRWIICFRAGEFNALAAEIMHTLVEAGHAVHIELEPLDLAATREVLADFSVGKQAELVTQLARFTGGNPLFLLETVRHLLETGRLSETLPERLPLPSKVRNIIRMRLERLSPIAIRIAQTAAVLQSDFDPALIGDLLNFTALEMLEPWEELEKAQVLTPTRFTHDLIYEAVRTDTPVSVRILLHRRAAEVLAARQASPLLVAEHWKEAQDGDRAVSVLIAAAEAAKAELRLEDAEALRSSALGVLEERGDEDGTARVRALLA